MLEKDGGRGEAERESGGPRVELGSPRGVRRGRIWLPDAGLQAALREEAVE